MRAVAEHLERAGLRVFSDANEQVDLWGKDLYQHLSEIYRRRAGFCVIFLSAAYAQKLWTRHELRSAQARAFEESREYILPARFDDTEIPGMPPTVGYIGLAGMTPKAFAKLIVQKVHGAARPAEMMGHAVAPCSDRTTRLKKRL